MQRRNAVCRRLCGLNDLHALWVGKIRLGYGHLEHQEGENGDLEGIDCRSRKSDCLCWKGYREEERNVEDDCPW